MSGSTVIDWFVKKTDGQIIYFHCDSFLNSDEDVKNARTSPFDRYNDFKNKNGDYVIEDIDGDIEGDIILAETDIAEVYYEEKPAMTVGLTNIKGIFN